MDQHVHQMITHEIVAVEVVIQCETDTGYRTVALRAVKPGSLDVIPGKVGEADMGVLLNIELIIENERSPQVV